MLNLLNGLIHGAIIFWSVGWLMNGSSLLPIVLLALSCFVVGMLVGGKDEV